MFERGWESWNVKGWTSFEFSCAVLPIIQPKINLSTVISQRLMDYRRVDPRCVMVPCEHPALWMPYLAFHEESSFTSQVRNLVHFRTAFCRSLLICVLQRNLLNYLSRTVISSGSARCHNSKQNTSLNLEIIPHWFLPLGAASLLDRSENILLLHKIRAWWGPWSPYDTFYF